MPTKRKRQYLLSYLSLMTDISIIYNISYYLKMSLHANQSSPPPMSYSYHQYKLQQASILKAKGIQHFKNSQYAQAIEEYKKVIDLLQPSIFYAASQAEQYKMVQLRSSTFFNIGLSSVKIQRWQDAEKNFDEAIKLNPNYAKAYFKRGLTKIQRGEKENGFKDIQYAYTLDPKNSQIQGYFFRIVEEIEADQNKKKESAMSNKQEEKEKQQKKQKEKSKQQEVKETKIAQKPKSVGFWVVGLIALAGIIIYKNLKKQ